MRYKKRKQGGRNTAFVDWLKANKFTSEQFVDEARRRGESAKYNTVIKWRCGTQPRPTYKEAMERAFPGIRFS